LHPHGFRAGLNRLVDDRPDIFRAAKDIDHVDRLADLPELTPDIFAMDMLPGNAWVHRQHTVAMVLQPLHDAIARPARIVRRTDHRDRAHRG